jgi:hypothetical protein
MKTQTNDLSTCRLRPSNLKLKAKHLDYTYVCIEPLSEVFMTGLATCSLNYIDAAACLVHTDISAQITEINRQYNDGDFSGAYGSISIIHSTYFPRNTLVFITSQTLKYLTAIDLSLYTNTPKFLYRLLPKDHTTLFLKFRPKEE